MESIRGSGILPRGAVAPGTDGRGECYGIACCHNFPRCLQSLKGQQTAPSLSSMKFHSKFMETRKHLLQSTAMLCKEHPLQLPRYDEIERNEAAPRLDIEE